MAIDPREDCSPSGGRQTEGVEAGCDACEEGEPSCWVDFLLGPREACAASAVVASVDARPAVVAAPQPNGRRVSFGATSAVDFDAVESRGRREAGASAEVMGSARSESNDAAVGIGVGIGTSIEPMVEAGVQANDGPQPLHPLLASNALGTRDAARIAGFLQGLKDMNSPADAATVNALLRLLKELPPPEGPRVLMNAIRHEQPSLFERLLESMRRTKSRLEGASSGGGAAAPGNSSGSLLVPGSARPAASITMPVPPAPNVSFRPGDRGAGEMLDGLD